MTKSLAVKGKEARTKHDKIVELQKTMSIAFLILGKELKDMKDNNYWKFIVGEDMNWGDYCQEIDVNRNYADVLIRLYETFILKLKFDQQEIALIDQRKLIAILPLSTDRESAETLIEDAKVLSRGDLLLKVHQSKNPPESCEHIATKVNYWYCKKCREKLTQDEVDKLTDPA